MESTGESFLELLAELLIELVFQIVPGLSLVIGPLAAGGVMHLLGRAEAQHGRAGSRLATFWGGALFAFSFSLARLMLLPA